MLKLGSRGMFSIKSKSGASNSAFSISSFADNVVDPVGAEEKTSADKFEKPAPKGDVKLIDKDNLDELINLLHNEAKAI